jgi:hypothetical protein
VSKNGGITLNEVLGNKVDMSGPLGLKDLPKLLGPTAPQVDINPIGRIRLIRALARRFGANYKSVPGVKDIMNDFDKQHAFARTVQSIKGGR